MEGETVMLIVLWARARTRKRGLLLLFLCVQGRMNGGRAINWRRKGNGNIWGGGPLEAWLLPVRCGACQWSLFSFFLFLSCLPCTLPSFFSLFFSCFLFEPPCLLFFEVGTSTFCVTIAAGGYLKTTQMWQPDGE